ncbi:uncharacterized protein Z518_07729 [Rhinocladiella mackenziei CBS 650.93]|uniref:Short-chain dehydrogenase/reductase n=1 Tax=Rhinocladiella mackenziei CBS 650.93 TaxID=1442369 RepID=A0A0D2J587_9EURO|nr:uncharacterized protein Z518_07729 [Rhinocladiella mackenziei CBS 650.93]KIX04175.1 hypothetical protein Z518_07729 [Rhinocladiella mackenziei CBS 650.93]
MPRTVLITGCSDGGLGAYLAVAFHNHGDRVFATARNPSKTASLRPLGIKILSLDVLSDESIKACVQEVSVLTGGSLDVLVNNAGGGYNAPVVEASIPQIQDLFDLNVCSIIRTTQHFLPLLRNAKDGALIANNTSVSSVFYLPWQAPYNASKAAAAAITENMRLELQPFGIKVVELKTGGVKSRFFENSASRIQPVLSESSIYAPAREKIESVLGGDLGVTQMSTDQWARRVVKDLSKRSLPVQVWRGDSATKAWLILTFLPVGFLDFVVKKMSGLDMLEKKLKEEAKTK